MCISEHIARQNSCTHWVSSIFGRAPESSSSLCVLFLYVHTLPLSLFASLSLLLSVTHKNKQQMANNIKPKIPRSHLCRRNKTKNPRCATATVAAATIDNVVTLLAGILYIYLPLMNGTHEKCVCVCSSSLALVFFN